LNIAHWTT
jgi:hypothetical protein